VNGVTLEPAMVQEQPHPLTFHNSRLLHHCALAVHVEVWSILKNLDGVIPSKAQ